MLSYYSMMSIVHLPCYQGENLYQEEHMYLYEEHLRTFYEEYIVNSMKYNGRRGDQECIQRA